MAGINYMRVVLGGIVAGVVANVCDTLSGTLLMAEDMRRTIQRLGLDQSVLASTSVGVTWMVVDFVYALIIVWTYAAIRPRFGPGPTTAVLAGLVPYLAATSITFGFVSMGIFTPDVFWKNAVVSFVVAMLAALAGAAVYKET